MCWPHLSLWPPPVKSETTPLIHMSVYCRSTPCTTWLSGLGVSTCHSTSDTSCQTYALWWRSWYERPPFVHLHPLQIVILGTLSVTGSLSFRLPIRHGEVCLYLFSFLDLFVLKCLFSIVFSTLWSWWSSLVWWASRSWCRLYSLQYTVYRCLISVSVETDGCHDSIGNFCIKSGLQPTKQFIICSLLTSTTIHQNVSSS